jgi:hypothetical protein
MGRSLVAIESAEDGFVALCDCGTSTHVVTIVKDAAGEWIPTPMEFAFTCDGCLSSHWVVLLAMDAEADEARRLAAEAAPPEPAKPKGRCHRCNQLGLASTVTVGTIVTTAMGASGFYDEAGAYHYHDPNRQTSEFSCSQGHRWTEQRQAPCLSCDFGRDFETEIRYAD